MEKIEHNPLVSLSEELEYVVVVRDNASLKTVMDLKGKCHYSNG
jgi:TRAP-type uncharacterized transport system substrate-binding protein